jgi:hypothetical protein
MSKLPNGIRVISYELGSYLLRVHPLHFLLFGGRFLQHLFFTNCVSNSIAFDQFEYHRTAEGKQV